MIENPSFSTGNRCGHDRHNPILHLAYEISHKAPFVLQTLCQRIERFNINRSVLPPLQCSWQSNRQRRSESAEAIALVLKCITKYIDLVTFKVGFVMKGQWHNLSYKKMARVTGLSEHRVKRVMLELQRNGFVGVHEIKEQVQDKNGTVKYISKIAVKTVNLGLFSFFGLEQRVLKERRKAANRFKKRQQQERQAQAEAHIPECAKGLKGAAQARTTMQALKYQSKQLAKKLRKASHAPPDALEWDDGIPY